MVEGDFFKIKAQHIMQPKEMIHFYDMSYQTTPFWRNLYHGVIRLHGFFYLPAAWLLYKCSTAEAVRNPGEAAKRGSRYYFLTRIHYAVRYQDAELMSKLEHHPKKLEKVWERMKLRYDHERQHAPITETRKQWWAEYKRKNPSYA